MDVKSVATDANISEKEIIDSCITTLNDVIFLNQLTRKKKEKRNTNKRLTILHKIVEASHPPSPIRKQSREMGGLFAISL